MAAIGDLGEKRPTKPAGWFLRVILAGFLAGPSPIGWAQPSTDLNIVGRWPGNALAPVQYRGQIVIVGTRAFVGTYSGLQIIDIADPMNPRPSGRVSGVLTSGSLRCVGDYLYVATEWDCGMEVVDLSNPDHPRRVGHWENRITSSNRGLDAAGTHVYVADESFGLQIVDVSNPTHPLKVGDYEQLLTYDVRVENGLAYVAAQEPVENGWKDVLLVLDVADPGMPKVLGQCPVTNAAYVRLEVRGGYAYIVGQGLEVVDVQAPASPKSVRFIEMDGYVADVALAGTNCWLATESGVVRVDVSYPEEATVLDRFADGAWEAIAVEGTKLYAGGSRSYCVFDVTDPAHPRAEGQILVDQGSAQDIRVHGNRCYVANGDAGLRILSCADPTQLTALGALTEIGRAKQVRVDGDTALIVCSSSLSNYVVVADVANPTQATALARLPSAAYFTDLGLRDGFAFLASDWSLEVFDVRDRAHPVLVRSVEFLFDSQYWYPECLQLVETNALVLVKADRQNLGVVDVGDPSSATLAHMIDASGLAGSTEIQDFAVSAGHAFFACGRDALRILDLRNLTNAVLVGSLAVDGSVSMVAVDGGYAYLMGERWVGGDTEYVIRVVDIRNPAQPMPVAVYGQSRLYDGWRFYAAKALLPQGEHLYLALGSLGIQVARLPGPLDLLAQPRDTAIVMGGTANLSVQAFGGSSLTYQWYRGAAGDTSQPVTGATQPTLSATATAEPAQYWVQVSGPGGTTNSQAASVSNRRPVRLDLLGEWPGIPRGSAARVAVAGGLACVASGVGGLHLFDVANASAPQWLGAIKPFSAAPTTKYGNVGIESQLWSVAVEGDYAYAVGDHGLTIIDVSQPTNPSVAGHYGTEGVPGDICINGTTAYLSLDGRDLLALDIRDPETPLPPSAVAQPAEAGFGPDSVPVNVVDHYAYWPAPRVDPDTGWWDGTEWAISDISNPANPIRLGTVPTSGDVGAARARGQVALVFESVYTNSSLLGDVIEVFTLANPAAPVSVGSLEVTNVVNSIDIDGSWGYLATERGLDVIDLANPASPRLAAHVAMDGRPQGVLVRDGIAYVAAGDAGLVIVNVLEPEHPVILGSGSTGGGASCQSASLVGATAVAADGTGGLQLLDVKNPAPPSATGGYLSSNRVTEVHCQGGLLLVAEEPVGGIWHTHLRIYNPRDFPTISQVGDYVTEGHTVTLSFDVVDSSAYVVTLCLDITTKMWRPALEIVDLTRANEPQLLGRCAFLPSANGKPWVAATQNHAFVTLWGTGLVILDVSRPERPLRVGSYSCEYQLQRVRVSGSHAFVVGVRRNEPGGALLVLDISVPDVPRCVAVLEIGVDAQDLSLYSHYAFVAAGEEGVVVVDISDPEHPVEVGRGSMRGVARGVFMSSGTVVAAGGAYGISLFGLSPWLELHLSPVGAGQGLLSWKGGPGIRVQQCSTLPDPAGWTDVLGTEGATNAVVPLEAPGRYFRLIGP